MDYEALLAEVENEGLTAKEKPLKYNNGRIKGKRIAIRENMPETQKKCVLAEELGHYYTTAGNIIDLSDVRNQKQELRARSWAYDKQIGLIGIVNAYKHGCQNLYEMAEFLDVTEEFLRDALRRYREKHGSQAVVGEYVIFFEPYLTIFEIRD